MNGIKNSLKNIYDYMPQPLKSTYRSVKRMFIKTKPRFEGWGMQTNHELPWVNSAGSDVFNKAAEDIKKGFQFFPGTGVSVDTIDELKWRHWNICNALTYAVKFSRLRQVSLAECGVCDGMSSYFILRELEGFAQSGEIVIFHIHLYDAWEAMREEELKPSEKFLKDKYSGLSLNLVKGNLSEFGNSVTYHPGYIPEVFDEEPKGPEQIIFLHIDLNASVPTLKALEHFYPRLVRGGVIIFDDYGQLSYKEVKKEVDAFFKDKPGHLMPLATSQAVYFQP